jgi:hypothetical protein
MVALPSLPKIRLSELVVSFIPTTSGSLVVPEMYSIALYDGEYNTNQMSITHMLLSKCTKVESKCATDRVSVGS